MKDTIHLLKTRRFLPLFVTQFFGAFNDNMFKNALIILITYRLAQEGLPREQAQQMTILAAGVFILPFFLLSATAGKLADKYEKSRSMRLIKIIEVGLMLLGAIGFITHHTWLLMLVLFGMGTHSTFFGPLKYAVLPDHLKDDELIAGNGLIEAGTFFAILLGTIVGGLLILRPQGEMIVSLVMLSVAALGLMASRFIPRAESPAPELSVSANIAAETWVIFQHARTQTRVFLSILGISWFWFIGASFLAQFPGYVRYHLGGDEQVITLVLTMFSLGIAVGSVYCNRLMKGEIHGRYVPAGAVGMGIGTLALVACSPGLRVMEEGAALLGVMEWITQPHAWGVLASLFAIAVFGGIYTVPLYALIQHRAETAERSRMVAANNIVNALFMVVSGLLCVALLKLGLTVVHIFLLMGLANFPVAWRVKKRLDRLYQEEAAAHT
jgi:acyl-[acyl-carrier-protein]-phospholipid O-acyltransferase/long-chain-fatty-acid--[acyl-carrier-protein] ligase